MRRLKHASFSRSGPPAEWERRFAAIVRERALADSPASIDRFELPLPSSPLPAAPPPPSPPPPSPSRSPRAVEDQPPAGVAAAEVGVTGTGGWAASWAAQIATKGATEPDPGDGPPISFDGFAAVVAAQSAPRKASAVARLKRRLLKPGGLGSRPPAPMDRGTETHPPSAPARGAGREIAARGDKASGPATPDFPRRPAARATSHREVERRDANLGLADLRTESPRPGAAAWLSRADGPLRTTAQLSVAGPALAAAAIVVACGLSAAYLAQRFGLDFDPVVRTVARPLAPVQASAIAGAPAAPPSASPVTLAPSSVTPPQVAPALGAPLALAPPSAPPAVEPRAPQAGKRVALGKRSVVPPTPTTAPLLQPTVAGHVADGPVVASAAAVPRDVLEPVRPAFTTPLPRPVSEVARLLPFPGQAVSAHGVEAEVVASGRPLGWPDERVAPLAAPLAPRSLFAAEAITAETLDAVPPDGRPSDARVAPKAWVAVSPLVADIQRALRRHGFDPGPVDGIAGPRTVAAVRSFQRRVGQLPDGVADTALLRDLKQRPETEFVDGAPGANRAGDPLAGLIRALSDLFGLPAEGGFDGSIASAGDQEGVGGGLPRGRDGRVGE